MFSILFILIFLLGFLANRDFPNGLFAIKELAFYVLVSIASLSIALLIFKRWKSFIFQISRRLCFINLVAFILLVLIPLVQYCFQPVRLSNLLLSVGTYILFYTLTFLGNSVHWVLLMRKFYIFLFIAFVLQILICIGQYNDYLFAYHSACKISGMFFNPGPFSIYFSLLLLMIVPFLMVYYRKRTIGKFILLIVTLALPSLAILFTLNSRSSWIGFSMGIFSIIGWYLFLLKPDIFGILRRNVKTILSILLPALCLLSYGLYQIRPESAQGRILIWKSTVSMIKDNPLLGVGYGNFIREYPRFQAKVLDKPGLNAKYGVLSGETEYAFNDVLQVGAELGLIGLFLYLTVFFHSFFRLYLFVKSKGYSDIRFVVSSGLGAALLCVFIAGMTSYPNQMLPINSLCWTIIALINLISSDISGTFPNSLYRKVGIVCVSLAISVFYGHFFIKKLHAYYLWNGTPTGALSSEVLLPNVLYMDNEAGFLNDLGYYYLTLDKRDKAEIYFLKAIACKFDKTYYYDLGKNYKEQNKYADALATYQYLEKAIPHLIKPKYLQAKLYYELGDSSAFKKMALKVMAAVPKVYNAETDLMKKEIKYLYNKSMSD